MNESDLKYLIEELKALPKESEWVEFKTNNKDPQTLGENISALSNSAFLEGKEYAYIIFGIEDGTHTIVGTKFNPTTHKIKKQEFDNYIRTLLEPRIDFKIFQLQIEGKNIVLFEIDAAEGRPVRFSGEAYIRIGSYTKKLKDHPEKEAKLWQKAKRVVFEKDYAKRNISPDEVIDLIDYPSFFKFLNLPLPSNKDGILEKLHEEKLIAKSLKRYHITNLGAILFANSLEVFEKLNRKAPRVIIYKGNNKLKTIREQEGTKGYASGFSGLVKFINDRLPSNEEIGQAFRREVKIYPELAIRELIANALIHQDFSIKGAGVMIEIFDNRIEITNPGKPLIDTQRFIDHSPESRNEDLARFMRRINICEERGSGIDKVVAQAETFQLPAPEFIEGDNYTRVILYSPKSLRQMSKKDKVRATYQHCCLSYLSGEYMTNKSLRKRFKIEKKNYSIVSRIIKQAVDDGVINEYDNARMYVPFWVQK